MTLIEDTYAEAFDGLFMRLMITAKDDTRLRKAAYGSTALPSIVINRTEGGIEKWLSPNETPDKRSGALIQYWGQYSSTNPAKSLEAFYKEASYRIRQGVLVVPTTAIFNAYAAGEKIDAMRRIGHCGDGHEWEERLYGRSIIRIPLMMGVFNIERFLAYGLGVMGGNLWIMCTSEDAALKAGEKALEAVHAVKGVITPFDICSAGSKPETNYPEIGPTTNHPYCPALRNRIPDSQLPNDVQAIPEIVINGLSLNAVKEGMKAAITSVLGIKGVVRISAGNYGGRLGKYKIFLHELIP